MPATVQKRSGSPADGEQLAPPNQSTPGTSSQRRRHAGEGEAARRHRLGTRAPIAGRHAHAVGEGRRVRDDGAAVDDDAGDGARGIVAAGRPPKATRRRSVSRAPSQAHTIASVAVTPTTSARPSPSVSPTSSARTSTSPTGTPRACQRPGGVVTAGR